MSVADIFPIDRWDFHSQAILTHLNEGEHNVLMAGAREEKYKKGEIIFREGAQPSGIFYVRTGKVKKYKIDNVGKEHIFYVAGMGELIGYHAVLADELYPDSAATLEDSIIGYITIANFMAALDNSPDLSRKLLKTLSHEFGVFINNLSVFAQRPVRERVAITLIILREKFKQGTQQGAPVAINISRNNIANMAGTSRENIARLLTEFRLEKIIDTLGRKILILDVRKLVDISNYA